MARALRIGVAVLGLAIPVAASGAQDALRSPKRGWVTAGIGASRGPVDGIAITAGGSFSAGPVIVTARLGGMGVWEGEQAGHKALLFGFRTPGPAWFGSVTAGVARAYASYNCSCGNVSPDQSATVLAFEAKGFHAFEVAASSLSFYATLGPRRHRHLTVTLSRDFGWFGADEGPE